MAQGHYILRAAAGFHVEARRGETAGKDQHGKHQCSEREEIQKACLSRLRLR